MRLVYMYDFDNVHKATPSTMLCVSEITDLFFDEDGRLVFYLLDEDGDSHYKSLEPVPETERSDIVLGLMRLGYHSLLGADKDSVILIGDSDNVEKYVNGDTEESDDESDEAD